MRLTSILRNRFVNPSTMGPIKTRLRNAKDTIAYMPTNKMWFTAGYRNAAIAAELIRSGKIVALPTDTVYGLAGMAQNDYSISRLYEIKERDPNKPLAICLCDVEDIDKWAHTEDLPEGLAKALLPGPTTLVLRRKPALNPDLNPDEPNVGIRVPNYDFVRSVVRMLNQPLALTSANKSKTISTLHPNEFEDLWPQLDGVFYEKMNTRGLRASWRRGSTVVDLTVKGEFEILRHGIGSNKTINILQKFDLIQRKTIKKKKKKNNEEPAKTEEDDCKNEEPSTLEDEKSKAHAAV